MMSARCSGYFLVEPLAGGDAFGVASFLRFAKNSPRFGIGTVSPFGVCSVFGLSGIDLQG
jgi:hypothetical protein